MLQDEGVRDRIRQAEEFLDPSMYTAHLFLSLTQTYYHSASMHCD